MSTTGLTVLTTAFRILNVYQSGDTISSADQTDGLTFLNNLIGTLGLQNQTAPFEAREIFPLVAGQGAPSTPYTIGSGGNFNTVRPATRQNLTAAGLLLGGTTPPIEIPRAVLDEEQYDAIRIKDLASALFTSVFYAPTFAGGLGSIFLYPVPNNSLHSVVLYSLKPLGAFSTLAASYDLPGGWEEMLAYNLAGRLAVPYGRGMPPEAAIIARDTLAMVKRSNFVMSDLQLEPMYTGERRGGYSIDSGDYVGR